MNKSNHICEKCEKYDKCDRPEKNENIAKRIKDGILKMIFQKIVEKKDEPNDKIDLNLNLRFGRIFVAAVSETFDEMATHIGLTPEETGRGMTSLLSDLVSDGMAYQYDRIYGKDKK